MRGFNDNDAFPASDYGLNQELRRHPDIDLKLISPWRAYGAVALWKSFAAFKLQPAQSERVRKGTTE